MIIRRFISKENSVKRKIRFFIPILMSLSISSLAQPTKLDSILSLIVSKYSMVGMSITVTKNSDLVFSQGYGLRDIARGLPVDENTKYRIASISKMVTATALMQLYERGLFKLNDSVSNDLGFDLKNPSFPDQPITFRMLLSHTSSLRDGSGYDRFLSDSYNKTPPPAIRELLVPSGSYFSSNMFDRYRSPDQLYFQYANINYGVIGTLVEKISGERFDVYCRKNIFEPLGMVSSFNVRDLPDINDVAVLYRKSGGIWVPQADQYSGSYPPQRDLSGYRIGDNGVIFSPQGGLRTSSNDLAKFMLYHQQGGVNQQVKILNDTTVARMHKVIWRYNGSNGDNYYGIFKSYACGNHTTTDLLPGQELIGHPGEAYGLISDMYFETSGNYGIVFITNGGLWGSGQYSGWYNIEEEVYKACFAELDKLSTSVRAISVGVLNFELTQNYPNPFNPTTAIKYYLPQSTQVQLKIFNFLGHEVNSLVDNIQPPGAKLVIWDGTDKNKRRVSSGVYFYTLQTGTERVTRKMLLVR